MYKNCDKFTLSVKGNTTHDRAFSAWNEMSPIERLKIMNKVYPYKTMDRKFRACVNYLAEKLEA